MLKNKKCVAEAKAQKIALQILLSFLLLILASTLNAEEVVVGEVPSWVNPVSITTPEEIPQNLVSGGVYYIVVDKQILAEDSKEPIQYTHYAEMVVNREGLESISQISINYDPGYQKLTILTLPC